jgi:hypothetical protein
VSAFCTCRENTTSEMSDLCLSRSYMRSVASGAPMSILIQTDSNVIRCQQLFSVAVCRFAATGFKTLGESEVAGRL